MVSSVTCLGKTCHNWDRRQWVYAAPDLLPRPLRAIGEFGKDHSANNGDHAFDVNGDGWVDVIAGGFQETEV